jgi:hypothetical protein
LPISRWHEQICDPTIADGILDRLVHNSHRIEMRGESMRKRQSSTGRKQGLIAGLFLVFFFPTAATIAPVQTEGPTIIS